MLCDPPEASLKTAGEPRVTSVPPFALVVAAPRPALAKNLARRARSALRNSFAMTTLGPDDERLPGQKKKIDPNAQDGEALKLFYTTLHQQRPDSEMAQRFMMEHGLLEEAEAAAIFKKLGKPGAAKKSGGGGGAKRSKKDDDFADPPKKKKPPPPKKKVAVEPDSSEEEFEEKPKKAPVKTSADGIPIKDKAPAPAPAAPPNPFAAFFEKKEPPAPEPEPEPEPESPLDSLMKMNPFAKKD